MFANLLGRFTYDDEDEINASRYGVPFLSACRCHPPFGFVTMTLRNISVRRIAEAAGSWMTLNAIHQQFGSSPDGAVERDLAAAEARLEVACKSLLNDSDGESLDGEKK